MLHLLFDVNWPIEIHRCVCMCFLRRESQIFPLYISVRIRTFRYFGSLCFIVSFCSENSSFLSHTPIILMLSEMYQKRRTNNPFSQTESSNMKQKQYNKSRRKTLDILIQLACCKIDGDSVNGNLLVSLCLRMCVFMAHLIHRHLDASNV